MTNQKEGSNERSKSHDNEISNGNVPILTYILNAILSKAPVIIDALIKAKRNRRTTLFGLFFIVLKLFPIPGLDSSVQDMISNICGGAGLISARDSDK